MYVQNISNGPIHELVVSALFRKFTYKYSNLSTIEVLALCVKQNNKILYEN